MGTVLSGTAVPQIELRPADSLVGYARNARTHSPDQIRRLKASMLEFGWTNTVLADASGIVAGHGRVAAARQLYAEGHTLRFPNGAAIPAGMVPVLDCTGWSDAQRRAYILADNKLALDAGWDAELLRLELADLAALSFCLDTIGWDDAELAEIMAGDPQAQASADPDDVPDTPAEPVSRRGDVWCIGDHRVMCGSSLEPADWGVLMAGELADAVWTDPPYNVDIGAKNDHLAKVQKRKNKTGAILNDSMGDQEFYGFLLAMYRAVYDQMKPGAPIYVFHADTEGINFRTAFRDAGFKLQSVLQWRKNTFVLARTDHQPITEPCLYGWRPGAAHRWYGGRRQSTIFEVGGTGPFKQLPDGRWAVEAGDEVFIVSGDAVVEAMPGTVITEPKPSKSELHPTMKPVNLVARQLRNSARRGDLVIDAFGGSGSTAVAAQQCGMRARLMELDPKYVDVAVRRLEMFMGARAVHAVTGELFPRDGEVRAPDQRPETADVF